MGSLPKRIFAFYRDGFRSMVVGRTLWKIIAIKLFILFAVLKVFFFPNYLKTNFETDTDKILDDAVRDQLCHRRGHRHYPGV